MTREPEDFQALARAYRDAFATGSGEKVLADLRRAFGWGRSSAGLGDRAEDVFLREGMRAVLLHIDRMRADDAARPRPQKTARPSGGTR